MKKLINGISLKDTEYGLMVTQYSDSYIARRWKISPNLVELVQTALDSKLYWLIRDGHPQVHALWPSTKGRVYLAFSPTRDKHWALAIDSVSSTGLDYGKAVFNGKYHGQFLKHDIKFSFEKRNTGSGHMEVSRDQVLPTIRKMANFDHSVLYKNKSSMPVNGFSTEYDIQRSILSSWSKTPFAKNFEIIGDEVPVDLGSRNASRRNLGRIDILAKSINLDEYLVIEIKRAEADIEVLDQIKGYLAALRKNDEMSSASIRGVLIAERIPERVLSSANQLGFETYKIEYPINLKRL
jgi:hypothetical protein